MSYHERQAIVSLITTLLLALFFVVLVLPKYPAGNPYSAQVFHFWGLAAVILVPVSIVVTITMSILFNLTYTMATREHAPSFADERDKFIALRSLRNARNVFAVGFFLAMGALALGLFPSVMFILLLIAGYGSGLVANISEIYLYRKGS